MPFTERTPIEQGFAPIYETEVLPILGEFEFERQAMRRRSLRNIGLMVLGGIVALIAVALIWSQDSALRLSPVVAIGVGIFAWADWAARRDKFKAALADSVMPKVCGHVGDLDYSASGSAFSLSALREMRLIPTYDDAYRTSLLSGTHAGQAYQIVQTKLTTTTRNSNDNEQTTTVFEGLLFRITLTDPAPGRIALMRDRGGLGNKLAETFSFGSTRSLPKVTFNDARFEAMFETYADTPDAAQSYLTETRRAALVDIGQEHGRLVAGFEGRDFYIALERNGGFIEMGSLNAAATELEECLHGVFDDLTMSHRMIERLTAA